MHPAGPFRVERQVELVVPAHFIPGMAHLQVAFGRSGMSFRDVRRMGGQFVSYDAFADIVLVRQGQVLLGGYVAQHGGSHPSDHRRADRGGNVVVSGSDVADQRSQRVERGPVAVFDLLVHIFTDFLHRNVSRPFDNDLYVVFPCDFSQFSEYF